MSLQLQNMNSVNFWGLNIKGIKKYDVLNNLHNGGIIFTPNPEILLISKKNKKYTEALKNANFLLPDGHGLLFVSTLLKFNYFLRIILYFPALLLFLIYKKPFKKIYPELIHGSDFMYKLVAWAYAEKKSVFFLGGKDSVAKKTANFFESKFNGLKVAGYSSKNPEELDTNTFKTTDVIFVAYGSPKQEFWINENQKKITGNKIFMGVGGSFDFYSGEIKRAPLIFRKLGLEWLWRLFLQPKTRAKRIYNAFIKFPLICLFFSQGEVFLQTQQDV